MYMQKAFNFYLFKLFSHLANITKKINWILQTQK